MRRLFEYLEIYRNSKEVEAVQKGYQAVLDRLFSSVFDAQKQVFVLSATWALELWEKYLGLNVDASLSEVVRRERIISKLRGAGTTTKVMIERMAESYANGEVEVTEQNELYQFTIKFISTRGQPAGLTQLKTAIEEIKPAHLGVAYLFVYTTHGELNTAERTHAMLADYMHNAVKTMEV